MQLTQAEAEGRRQPRQPEIERAAAGTDTETELQARQQKKMLSHMYGPHNQPTHTHTNRIPVKKLKPKQTKRTALN